jgi:hypothetical protein
MKYAANAFEAINLRAVISASIEFGFYANLLSVVPCILRLRPYSRQTFAMRAATSGAASNSVGGFLASPGHNRVRKTEGRGSALHCTHNSAGRRSAGES